MSIKECFISRWVGGYIVDVDFSQLEVVALALLSKDWKLIQDIRDGLDMHTIRAADLFGVDVAHVSTRQRQLAKQLSFQLQYGAGAKSMAEKNEITKELAEKFIKQYYERYPEVKAWQDCVIKEVKSSRKNSGKFTPKGFPVGVGEHISPTGRIYKFFEYDSNYGREDTSFSPTEMKNYPVQGFAADIMALYRGKVYRRFLEEGEQIQQSIKLINTVHDSVMLDVDSGGMVHYVYEVMKEQADRLPSHLNSIWGIDCPVDFKIECKYGPNWGDMYKLL